MNLSDIIEAYIKNEINGRNEIELKRSELAHEFNCVPSQINYVISTRFIPELGFYVESKRGGGGYIKITKVDLSKAEYINIILSKIGKKLSQSVMNIYLKEMIRYNILDIKYADIISSALSESSLKKVNKLHRDEVRADMFKNILLNII